MNYKINDYILRAKREVLGLQPRTIEISLRKLNK